MLLSSSYVYAQDFLPSNVTTRDTGAGTLFVNSAGLTLYTYKRDSEQPGTSTCAEECADAWPPLITNSAIEAIGDWSLIERQDGTRQWAYKNKPLYTYSKDTHPGAIVGEKASGFWDVLFEPIQTPPSIVIQGSVRGQILANINGLALYSNTSGSCDESCLRLWRPLEAPWLARSMGSNWTITRYNDGLAQWAFDNRPLYTYTGDSRKGEMNGLGAQGPWDIVILQDPPAYPDWVTIQETDLGPVMATQTRMTLYYLTNDPEQINRETCDAICVSNNWNLVIVPEGTEPIGNWSIRGLHDGRHQLTYLGLPVFTYKHDKIPGDTWGDKFGTGSDIRGGWSAILEETLIQELAS